METNLIEKDMQLFLTKYKRLLSKNIYISNKIYNTFINSYKYLDNELNKNIFLYQNTKNYQEIQLIKDNPIKLLKHHNQLYLNNNLNKNKEYFDSIYNQDILNNTLRKVIMVNEEELLFINKNNNIPLITSKIKYLIEKEKYHTKDILVVADNIDNYQSLTKEIKLKTNYNIKIITSENYFKNQINIINDNTISQILLEYLKNILFPNKDKFNKFYHTFKLQIYLNKDYNKFSTFREYHDYLYHKFYLNSTLTLKKFNELEIKKRKKFLRTINNEILNCKEEVDIANFLYLNNINYKYLKDKQCFYIHNSRNYNYIKYNQDYSKDNKTISLSSNNYLSKLAYELIKLRYPLEKIPEEITYNCLKDTTENNYFLDLINYLIKIIKYYEENNNLDNLNLSKEKKIYLIEIIDYYYNYIKNKNLITNQELNNLIIKDLNKNKNYKYIIILNNKFNTKSKLKIKNFTIINKLEDNLPFKNNIKLDYEYKKYLNNNKIIPVLNSYLNYQELINLTNNYTKDNIKTIEKYLNINSNISIKIYIYDDKDRLSINNTKGLITNNILKKIKNKKEVLILGKENKDLNIIVNTPYFQKKNNTTIINNKNYINYSTILKKDYITYNNTILLNLIPDKYSEVFLIDYNITNTKLLLYKSLLRTKQNLYILWPKSKNKELRKYKIKNVTIYE